MNRTWHWSSKKFTTFIKRIQVCDARTIIFLDIVKILHTNKNKKLSLPTYRNTTKEMSSKCRCGQWFNFSGDAHYVLRTSRETLLPFPQRLLLSTSSIVYIVNAILLTWQGVSNFIHNFSLPLFLAVNCKLESFKEFWCTSYNSNNF